MRGEREVGQQRPHLTSLVYEGQCHILLCALCALCMQREKTLVAYGVRIRPGTPAV